VTRDWDAQTYDRVSDVQVEWAREVLDRLPLNGDETVLDAGCGSGRVTAKLLDRLPRGHVVAVDGAPSMVVEARELLGDRATVIACDLVDLELDEPVDAVFSSAVFHWIPDHDALFAALHRTLKPGGRLVAQCGGKGNINRFRVLADEVATSGQFAPYFSDWHGPWNYADETTTAARLRQAGFTDISCWLEPKSVTPGDPQAFIGAVCLVRHLDRLPEELKPRFVDAVLERVGEPFVLDYVRLNMTATRDANPLGG
jgi:trans-aconitate 2-methyltransferase